MRPPAWPTAAAASGVCLGAMRGNGRLVGSAQRTRVDPPLLLHGLPNAGGHGQGPHAVCPDRGRREDEEHPRRHARQNVRFGCAPGVLAAASGARLLCLPPSFTSCLPPAGATVPRTRSTRGRARRTAKAGGVGARQGPSPRPRPLTRRAGHHATPLLAPAPSRRRKFAHVFAPNTPHMDLYAPDSKHMFEKVA